MWSLETLDYLNRQAARKAGRSNREPYVPALEEIDNFPPFPFPNLGPYVPAGWESRTQRGLRTHPAGADPVNRRWWSMS